MSKFKKGDKVIPISKSTGCSFESSIWKNRHRKKQHYLYINAISPSGRCVCDFSQYGGDYFLEQDLVLYVESRDTLNKQLLNGEIDFNTYQSLIKEVT